MSSFPFDDLSARHCKTYLSAQGNNSLCPWFSSLCRPEIFEIRKCIGLLLHGVDGFDVREQVRFTLELPISMDSY